MSNQARLILPDIDQKDNREYTYVWALIDSGAGTSVARKSHFPDAVPMQAPKISLSTANGERMPNRGAFKVVTMNKAGEQTTRRFYDADVDMPILSVAELSQEGQEGSDVRFRRRDGYVEDNLTKKRDYFVKRKGNVLFEFYIPRVDTVGFARPGP